MKKAGVLSILFAAAAIDVAAQTLQYPSDIHQQNDFTAPTQDHDEVLQKLHEPPLSEQAKDANARVYRLLWSRSMAIESPISVRLSVNEDGTGLVTVKIMTRRAAGVGDWKEKTRKVSRKKTERFLAQVQKLNYWGLPAHDPRSNDLILDGSVWIVEGVENGNHRLIRRRSPGKGPVRQLGISLIHLAGLHISARD